jgi:hypothetical protein
MAVNKRHRNGDTMHDAARKRAFGLQPKDKWPDEGLQPIGINTSWGVVLHEVRRKDDPLKLGTNKGRRAVACCPVCYTPVCAGHLGQHMAGHNV